MMMQNGQSEADAILRDDFMWVRVNLFPKWLLQAETDRGRRGDLTSDERQRVKDLEREVRELRRANEIMRKASAYFAQAELDRRPK
jgi:transposase-like protein